MGSNLSILGMPLGALVPLLVIIVTVDLASYLAIFERRKIERQLKGFYQRTLKKYHEQFTRMLGDVLEWVLCLLLGGRNSAICRSMFEGHKRAISALDIDYERCQMATVSEDGYLKVWDLVVGNLLYESNG